MRYRTGTTRVWAVRLLIAIVLVVVLAMIAVGAAQLDLGGDGRAVRARSGGSVVDAESLPAAAPEPEQSEDRGLVVVDAQTWETRPIPSSTFGTSDEAEASPDGSRVVYERTVPGGTSQVYVLDALGMRQKLTRFERGAHDPTWSPDGTQIAFSASRGSGRDRDIFVMQADGSRIRRVAATPARDGRPDWSPDGSRIAFQSGVNEGAGRSKIMVLSITDDALRTLPLEYWGGDPAWSPDGRWIAFSMFAPGTLNGEIPYAELRLVRPDGSQEHRLGSKEYSHWKESPSWSPDGRSIVFDDRGHMDIIHVRTERIRTVLEAPGQAQPSWGHDGILASLPSVDLAASPGTGWEPSWEPTWNTPKTATGRVDGRIVFSGSACSLRGADPAIRPGPLRLRFVNDSFAEVQFEVVRLAVGERPGALRTDPRFGDGRFLRPLTTRSWSSAWGIESGRFAVVCLKDVIRAANGFQMMLAGIAGPLHVGP